MLATFSIWKAITGKDHNAIPKSIQHKRVFHASVVNMILVQLNISKCSFWHHSCQFCPENWVSLLWWRNDSFMAFSHDWISSERWISLLNEFSDVILAIWKTLYFILWKILTAYRKLRSDQPIRRKGEKSLSSWILLLYKNDIFARLFAYSKFRQNTLCY